VSEYFSPIENFEFSQKAIAAAVKDGRLLSMEIEFSLRCNFRCAYCYVPHDSYFKGELTRAQIKDAILQAKALGALKIIILGGEPSIYPHTLDLIRFIRSHGLQTEMFTNGTGITPGFAEQLHANHTRVVLKMNSFDPALQDRLAGYAGAFLLIQNALAHLKNAGYPSPDHFLAVSTIICRQNIAELPRMWQWLREQQIAPYFEIITPQANAQVNDWLFVDPLELKDFFERIRQLDRRLFGQNWDAQPPLVGNKCMRHQFSCLLTSKGDVMPCVGINLAMGNIGRQPLGEILAGSQILKDLKNYRHTIKGPCRTCDKAHECYGCRGAAFQLTGDYLASDPLCWRNASRPDLRADCPPGCRQMPACDRPDGQ
jgi:radical SAM protein with 4Fe4S-binding SPASM domain